VSLFLLVAVIVMAAELLILAALVGFLLAAGKR
jgi:hypothetical protein